MATYIRPAALDDALAALADGDRMILAGGTDYYPARVGRPLDDDVVDITGLTGLRGIDEQDGTYRFGALATWTDVLRADLPPWFDGLKLAAREIGGVQVQNAGTVVGNLCNASPAADGVPNLLALDAAVELAARDGRRTLPLDAFLVGNRATARRPDEIVTAVLVPPPPAAARSTFAKLGARRYLVISIVMVAVVLASAADGTVADVRVAVGACSATAQRLPELEAALRGRPLDAGLAAAATADHLVPLAPIDDVRGTAGYRRDAALTLVRRALAGLASA